MKIQHAHAFYLDLFDQHGAADWKIRWNRMPGEAGSTSYSTKTVTFSALAVERFSDEAVVELGKHELGHVLVGPGHEHGRVWKATVKELGGDPEVHCPDFSTVSERVFGTSENRVFLLVVVIGAFIVSAPIGIVLAVLLGGWAGVQHVRNSRVVLTDAEMDRIEQAVRRV